MKKAFLCRQYGEAKTLSFEHIPTPPIKNNEVRIEVRSCGLNFPDTLTIRGKDQYKPPLPFSPGAEMAGVVKEVGADVRDFNCGDKVFGGTVWGAMREELVMDTRNLHIIPDTMDFNTASAFAVTFGTAYHCLVDRAHAKKGETVAILGASGGVGMSLIQVAKAMGLRVIACASTDDKLDFCQHLGADECVNYSSENLKTRLKELTQGRGVDVLCDPVGSSYSEAALRATAWGGRFMVLGFTAGEIARIPLNLPLLKGNCICGVFWSTFAKNFPQQNKENFVHLLNWWEEGAIAPVVTKVFPFERAPEAFEWMESRRAVGKVVIEIQSST